MVKSRLLCYNIRKNSHSMSRRPLRRQAVSAPSRAHAPRSSLYARITRQSVLLTALTITLLGALSFLVARSLVTDRILVQVSDAASVREDMVEEALHGQRERTSLLALRSDVVAVRTAASARAVLQGI